MPLYHFHISGDRPFDDHEGIELPDDQIAWREAVRTIRDAEEHLRPNGKWCLYVREAGRVVFLIEVSASSPVF